MRIGLDFDNTLVQYDDVFQALGRAHFSVPHHVLGKMAIRDFLRSRSNPSTSSGAQVSGETQWRALQGMVYGPHMVQAIPSPGVINFISVAKRLNVSLYIVSHKTCFASHDPTRTPLRRVAQDWLDQTGISDFIPVCQTFFCASRAEKIQRLTSLKLDVFIDDLVDIFYDLSFPHRWVKGILFAPYDKKDLSSPVDAFPTWDDITQALFAGLPVCLPLTRAELPPRIERIPGGGNNHLYRLTWTEQDQAKDEQTKPIGQEPVMTTAIYKGYRYEDQSDIQCDGRASGDYPDRMRRELAAYDFFHKADIKTVARLLGSVIAAPQAIDPAHRAYGIMLEDLGPCSCHAPTEDDLKDLVRFISAVTCASAQAGPGFAAAPLGKGACFSVSDIRRDIQIRRHHLTDALSSFGSDFTADMTRVLMDIYERLDQIYDALDPVSDQLVPPPWPILSPSDLGFHNAVHTTSGCVWLDFEYFGRDDLAKLICDTLLHPASCSFADPEQGTGLTDDQKTVWVQALFTDLGQSDFASRLDDLQRRVTMLMPLFALRWVYIILNPLSCTYPRISITGGDKGLEALRCNRLERAQSYLCFMSRSGWLKWLAALPSRVV